MVSSEEEPDVKRDDPIQWDVNMEVQLFYAMADHKPIGINKHFQMACIWEQLSNSITKEISTQDIWKHLGGMYDLAMLEDTEIIPFPNHEVTFTLPESEFGALMKQKCKETVVSDENEGPRKDSISALATKARKESGSSHASTDTPSIKSEKDDRRRDSRDSNASGPKDGSSSRKSISQREKIPKSKLGSVAAAWDSPVIDDENVARRGRRRANTSTPSPTVPAKRRRT